MKRILLLLPFVAVMTTVPHAAQFKNRLGFVNVQQLVATMPSSANYLALSKKADSDLSAQQKNLQTLLSRVSSSRSAADQNAFNKAQQSYMAAQKNYQLQLAQAFKPLANKINGAVANTARSNGFSIILDKQIAARSKLVVYADTNATDTTTNVLKALRK